MKLRKATAAEKEANAVPVGTELVVTREGGEIGQHPSEALIRKAFEALPEEQRAVLTLVVLDDLSYAEAADALNVPIGTIMSRLSRARAAMAAHMRRETFVEIRKKK